MTDKLASEIFEDAAQELRDHGKCTGDIMSRDGRVCLLGAVALAAELEVTHRTQTFPVLYELPMDVIIGLNAIADRHVPEAMDKFDVYAPRRLHAAADPVDDRYLRERASKVTLFNDDSLSHDINAPVTPATETEIIDALMEQAKIFRNEGR